MIALMTTLKKGQSARFEGGFFSAPRYSIQCIISACKRYPHEYRLDNTRDMCYNMIYRSIKSLNRIRFGIIPSLFSLGIIPHLLVEKTTWNHSHAARLSSALGIVRRERKRHLYSVHPYYHGEETDSGQRRITKDYTSFDYIHGQSGFQRIHGRR
jgi:hypothetical protein